MKFNLIKLKSVDSTNNYAINLLKKKNFIQSIIIANHQLKEEEDQKINGFL